MYPDQIKVITDLCDAYEKGCAHGIELKIPNCPYDTTTPKLRTAYYYGFNMTMNRPHDACTTDCFIKIGDCSTCEKGCAMTVPQPGL